MDALTFIVGIVQAIAWPLTLGGVIWYFRNEIRARFSEISRVSMGGASVDFGKSLDKAEEQIIETIEAEPVDQLPPPEPAALPPPDEQRSRFEDAVEAAPSLAILEAWRPIESELERIGLAHGYGNQSTTFMVRRLREDGLIERELSQSIDNLRHLRNVAVHSAAPAGISVEEARRYKTLADAVTTKLQEIA